MTRRDASLRQRRYAFADHGNSSQGQRQGKFLIKNNTAQHWTPCWGDGVTVIRPFPMRNIEDPNGLSWDPYRFSAEHNDFGDWLRRYDAVRNFGDPGVTMIIRDPSDPTIEDPQRLPAWVLYNAIDRAVSAGQEQQGWAALLRGGRNRGAVLSRPSEVYLIQGAIMQHKSEVYSPPRGFAPEEKPLVMELSSNAGVSLVTELNKPLEGSQAQDGDWEHMYANGDPVSLDYGRFITFYKLADGDPRTRQVQQAGGWNAATNQQQAGQRQQDPIGYGCYLEPTFGGFPARLRDYEQLVASKVQPWDDILWFPTIEEQANLLADKFPPDAILYAWRDHPEWIPETIRNRAVASHSVNAPQVAGGWHGGWNQQQGTTAPGIAASGFGAPPAGGMVPPAGGAPAAVYGTPQFPQPGQPQFPQQGVPPQVAPFQGQPQQPFPPQAGGFPQQTFPQPGQPQFPQQGVPPQVAPFQGQPQQPFPPQAGGFPQQTFPQPGQPQFPQGGPPQTAPQQNFVPPQGQQTVFGAPTGFGAPQQAPPQQGFGGPAGQPQQGFVAPSGPAPGQFQQPPQQFANGPTGGPPPALPPGGYPTTGFPAQAPQPAPQAAPQGQMGWAGQANPVAQSSPMGQTPGGFAPPPAQQAPPQQFQQPPQGNFPPQGQPQYPPQGGFAQQTPTQQMPPQGAPLSRAALALQAAQQAGQQTGQPQG